jgi:glyoxylase-like metal-dependent hydrolase (beta-lactamase superfamily II)
MRAALRLNPFPGAVILAGAALLIVGTARAETPYNTINAGAASSAVTVQNLRGGVAVLEGSGGNITVLSARGGQFMVDSGIAVSKPKIQAALATLARGPVRYVVDTHWHWDHTDGNGWLRAAGATIIAHPRTLEHLRHTIRVDAWEHTFPPVAAAALPNQTVSRQVTTRFAGERVRITPYLPAHTDGDLSVYFSREDVLATGDTYWNGLYPFIDYKAGGSIDGMIRAANANLALVGPHTIVVPGHGPVGGRADLIAYRDMLVAIRANVAALKSRDKSLDEIIAAKPTAAFDAVWGMEVISPELFTRLVYQGV